LIQKYKLDRNNLNESLHILKENFLVVNWDQRGSGKSYSFFMDKDNFTKNQLVNDAKEIIEYLCKNYGKDKIILVGHSWGTELGMDIIKSDF